MTNDNPAPATHRSRAGVHARSVIRFAMVVVLCAACDQAGGEDVARAVFRDSAGVRIAENPSPDDSAALPWWRFEGPLLDVGGEGVEEPYALFRVSTAMRLADGRVVVANGGSTDLRYYDAEGRHVATVGRSGEGPGEFRSVSMLMRGPGDSLTVYDIQARRLSLISPEPEFIRDFTFGEPGGFGRLIGRTTSGEFVGQPTGFRGAPGEMPSGLVRMDQPVTLHSATGELVDTIGTFPGAETFININTQGGQIASIEIRRLPFARSPSFALTGDELYVGSQDGPEISRYRLDGTMVLSIRTGRQPEPVTPEHLNAVIESRLENAPPERHAEMRAVMEATPHGKQIPPYGSFTVDPSGNLWVADHDDPLSTRGRFTVYGDDGGLLARIALPERFRPFDIGEDWILGLELDELDVEHVRLYRIVK
ncbi:MAG: hypothetical protein ACREL7_15245 [Longimicrobiales bacterium]